uniref:Uncharacterized protein n=1 Tax=Schistocephalus solidus TaxID=70667 RepID=A0A0X3Q3L8_SCHSO
MAESAWLLLVNYLSVSLSAMKFMYSCLLPLTACYYYFALLTTLLVQPIWLIPRRCIDRVDSLHVNQVPSLTSPPVYLLRLLLPAVPCLLSTPILQTHRWVSAVPEQRRRPRSSFSLLPWLVTLPRTP